MAEANTNPPNSRRTLLRRESIMKKPTWTRHLRMELPNESTAQSKKWHNAFFTMLAS
jgi:hypothetical protein